MVSSSLRERKRAASNTPRSAAYPPPSRRSVSSPVTKRSSNARFEEDSFARLSPQTRKGFLFEVPFDSSAGLRSVSAPRQKRARGARRRGEQLSERRRRRRRLHLGDGARRGGHGTRAASPGARARRAPPSPSRCPSNAELPGLLAQDAREVARAAQLPGHEDAVDQLLRAFVGVAPSSLVASDADASSSSSVSGEETSRGAHTARAESLRPRAGRCHASRAPRRPPWRTPRRQERGDERVRAEGLRVGRLRFSNRGRPWIVSRSTRFCSRGPSISSQLRRPRARARPSMALTRGERSRGTPRRRMGRHERLEPELRDAHLRLERRRRRRLLGENATETIADLRRDDSKRRSQPKSKPKPYPQSLCLSKAASNARVVHGVRDVFSSRRMSSYSNAMGAAHVIATFRVRVSPTTHAPKSIDAETTLRSSPGTRALGVPNRHSLQNGARGSSRSSTARRPSA